jgi:phospholipid-binding lipoprotein MlaA
MRLDGPGGRIIAILCGAIVVASPAAPALAQSVAATELAATTTEVPQDTPQTQILDPFEPVNRGLFRIDAVINNFFAGKGRILATARWLPRPLRAGLYNAFDNLDEPATFANDLMQRKIKRAGVTAGRFAINTTLGGLGVFDVAKKMKLNRTREDFGQTLGMYGITPGPYVFLPLAGPTTVRDSLSTLVDGMFNPLSWVKMTEIKRRSLQLARIAVQPSTIGIRLVARGAAAMGETPDD